MNEDRTEIPASEAAIRLFAQIGARLGFCRIGPEQEGQVVIVNPSAEPAHNVPGGAGRWQLRGRSGEVTYNSDDKDDNRPASRYPDNVSGAETPCWRPG